MSVYQINRDLLGLLEGGKPHTNLKKNPILVTDEDLEYIEWRWFYDGFEARSRLRELIVLGFCRIKEDISPITFEEKDLLRHIPMWTLDAVQSVDEVFSGQRFLTILEKHLKETGIKYRLAVANGSLRELVEGITKPALPSRHRGLRNRGRPSAVDHLDLFHQLAKKGFHFVFVAEGHTLTEKNLKRLVETCSKSSPPIHLQIFSLKPFSIRGLHNRSPGPPYKNRKIQRASIDWLIFFEGIRQGLIPSETEIQFIAWFRQRAQDLIRHLFPEGNSKTGIIEEIIALMKHKKKFRVWHAYLQYLQNKIDELQKRLSMPERKALEELINKGEIIYQLPRNRETRS